jgi:uncharacterized protein (TIGR00251 family)
LIALAETKAGIVLPVRAQPGARKSGLTGVHDGRLKVAVTAAPEKGKANAALVQVIAATLGLKRAQVELISGGTGTHKQFLISGVTLAKLSASLEAALAELER